jgi:hypothetical protein
MTKILRAGAAALMAAAALGMSGVPAIAQTHGGHGGSYHGGGSYRGGHGGGYRGGGHGYWRGGHYYGWGGPWWGYPYPCTYYNYNPYYCG